MIWSASATKNAALVRREREARERLAAEVSDARSDRSDLRQRLQVARGVVLDLAAEVAAARGRHATLTARLETIEARLEADECPPPEETR